MRGFLELAYLLAMAHSGSSRSSRAASDSTAAPTQIPTSVSTRASTYATAAIYTTADTYTTAPSLQIATEAVCCEDLSQPDVAQDIICPYGAFVTNFTVASRFTILEIRVYCSDGSYAGKFGEAPQESSSYYQSSVYSANGFASIEGESVRSSRFALVIADKSFGELSAYPFPTASWSCSCDAGQSIRGLRKPTQRFFTPTGFRLYCDTPCPSGFAGQNSANYTVVQDGPVVDYGGNCVELTPSARPSPPLDPTDRPEVSGVSGDFAFRVVGPDPATILIAIIAVTSAGACIVISLFAACFCCKRETPAVPHALYLPPALLQPTAPPSASTFSRQTGHLDDEEHDERVFSRRV